jgi:hypothetical protein
VLHTGHGRAFVDVGEHEPSHCVNVGVARCFTHDERSTRRFFALQRTVAAGVLHVSRP